MEKFCFLRTYRHRRFVVNIRKDARQQLKEQTARHRTTLCIANENASAKKFIVSSSSVADKQRLSVHHFSLTLSIFSSTKKTHFYDKLKSSILLRLNFLPSICRQTMKNRFVRSLFDWRISRQRTREKSNCFYCRRQKNFIAIDAIELQFVRCVSARRTCFCLVFLNFAKRKLTWLSVG